MILEQMFTDREKEQLNKFVNDELLVDLVRKVVLSAVYFEGTLNSDNPLENFALAFAASNITQKQKGEKLDASLLAVQLLNDGFARLQRFNNKTKKQEEERSNPAR